MTCDDRFYLYPNYWQRTIYYRAKKETAHFHVSCLLCWRYLFSRPVTRQLSSANLSLTSVFGMGTGGPSNQSTPTHDRIRLAGGYFIENSECCVLTMCCLAAVISKTENSVFFLVRLQGLEPGTHWLRVSCSTSWAKGGFLSGMYPENWTSSIFCKFPQGCFAVLEPAFL